MVQYVFHRYEKKYLVRKDAYQLLRQKLFPYMQEDAYGLHTIRNIYYDTETDELIRMSMEKPEYKEKFRVRCYGTPGCDVAVFLEIKKKYKGLVNKRRVMMSAEEAEDYLTKGIRPRQSSQVLKELDYFLACHEVVPKIYLAYDRIALFGKEDPKFRVTFDTNIRYRNEGLDLKNDENTTVLLGGGSYLMEVKVLDAMPLWFVHILEELKIRPVSFSKYGTAYKQNLLQGYYSYADKRRVCVC